MFDCSIDFPILGDDQEKCSLTKSSILVRLSLMVVDTFLFCLFNMSCLLLWDSSINARKVFNSEASVIAAHDLNATRMVALLQDE